MNGSRPLSTALQLYYLRRNPIAVGSGDVRLGRLVWTLEITPTPSSRTYRVRIELAGRGPPEVVVESPDLRALAGGRRLPHVYSETPVRLCLYHPDRMEWTSSMRLDETVVPWANLWLFYFELWLEAGEWKGGGEHPRPPRRAGGRSRQSRHRAEAALQPLTGAPSPRLEGV